MFCYTKQGKQEIKGKLLFVGDSISNDGRYISFITSYLALCQPQSDISVINIGVSSENTCGLSEPAHPFPRPCVHKRIDHALECVKPDYVFICYGVNDGIYYPFSQERFEAYKDGIRGLVDKIHNAGAAAIVMTPPPFDGNSFIGELADGEETEFSFMKPYALYDGVMEQYSRWIMEEMSEYADSVVDLHSAMRADIDMKRADNRDYISGDGIHPNLHGHWVMAQTILSEFFHVYLEDFETLMLRDDLIFYHILRDKDQLIHKYYKETIGHDSPFIDEYLPTEELFPAIKALEEQASKYSENHPELKEWFDYWNGYKRMHFFFNGYEAILVEPKIQTEQKNWIWRTEFFGAFPFADIAMLEQGYFIATIRICNLYGSDMAICCMEEFHNHLTREFELNSKTVLFGFSRGGLYAVNYAAKYPQNVACIYLDAPVVNLNSWPGGKGQGVGGAREWAEWKTIYNNSPEDQAVSMQENIDKLAELNLPMIIVAGDSDNVVPYNENGALIEAAYKNKGVPAKVILKPGIGHHPHSLENPQEIISFIVQTR